MRYYRDEGDIIEGKEILLRRRRYYWSEGDIIDVKRRLISCVCISYIVITFVVKKILINIVCIFSCQLLANPALKRLLILFCDKNRKTNHLSIYMRPLAPTGSLNSLLLFPCFIDLVLHRFASLLWSVLLSISGSKMISVMWFI